MKRTGYYADLADVSPEEYVDQGTMISERRINIQLQNNPVNKVYNNYNTNAYTNMHYKKAELGLFPTYFVSTKNKKGDRISYGIVNGQTGKVFAEVLIDFKKFLMWTIILAIPIFLILIRIKLDTSPFYIFTLSVFINMLFVFIYGRQKIEIKFNEKEDKEKRFYNGSISYNSFFCIAFLLGAFCFYSVLSIYLPPLSVIGFSIIILLFAKSGIERKELNKIRLYLIISTEILLFNTYRDEVIYAGLLMSIALAISTLANIVKRINLSQSRELPQLGKRGGNKNA